MNQPIGPGTLLDGGRWRLEEFLGEGEFGRVYRAVQVSLKRPVAVKLLKLSYASNREMKARFRREAEVLGKLTHPNVVAIYDSGLHKGQPYLVMEYVDGADLAGLLGTGPDLAVDIVVKYARQLFEALDHAHQAPEPVVNRDVKLENLMVDRQGRLKVCDFGLASLPDSDQTRLTATGARLGTASYLAPEQIEGEQGTPASDVYAAGVAVYRMLERRRPFDGPTQAALFHKILQGRPQPFQRTDVPDELKRLVFATMATDPATRPSAASVLEELRRLVVTLIKEPLVVGHTPPVSPPKGQAQPAGPPKGQGQSVSLPKGQGQAVGLPKGQAQPVSPSKGQAQPLSPPKGQAQPVSPSKGQGQSVSPSKGQGQAVGLPKGQAQRDREILARLEEAERDMERADYAAADTKFGQLIGTLQDLRLSSHLGWYAASFGRVRARHRLGRANVLRRIQVLRKNACTQLGADHHLAATIVAYEKQLDSA